MSTLKDSRSALVHVAVGVIQRRDQGGDEILLSKRLDHVHQGGLWEFPGGKVENAESVQEALVRELEEELGIECDLSTFEPLIKIRHDYPDKSVLLDVWVVHDFMGEPEGREGQALKWVKPDALPEYDFPAANLPIINACQLPSSYVITSDYASLDIARKEVAKILEKKPKMLLFRQTQLSQESYISWIKALIAEFPALPASLILSGQVLSIKESGSDAVSMMQCITDSELAQKCKGVHVPFWLAQKLNERPLSNDMVFGVSCHNAQELDWAERLNADFVTLSPVQKTSSHPDTPALGWQSFEKLIEPVAMPVFALGGMSHTDLLKAKQHGAQGIAGISMWQAL